MSRFSFLVLFAFVVLGPRGAKAEALFFPTSPPKPAPALVFTGEGGVQHSLKEYLGKYVLLNVWATWCPPCAREKDTLSAFLRTTESKNFVVIPLSADSQEGAVSGYYRRHSIKNMPIMVDKTKRVLRVFDIWGLPTTILIDPMGKEIARAEGPVDWESPETRTYLRKIPLTAAKPTN